MQKNNFGRNIKTYFRCSRCRSLVSKIIKIGFDSVTGDVIKVMVLDDKNRIGDFTELYRLLDTKVGAYIRNICTCFSCGNPLNRISDKQAEVEYGIDSNE